MFNAISCLVFQTFIKWAKVVLKAYNMSIQHVLLFVSVGYSSFRIHAGVLQKGHVKLL